MTKLKLSDAVKKPAASKASSKAAADTGTDPADSGETGGDAGETGESAESDDDADAGDAEADADDSDVTAAEDDDSGDPGASQEQTDPSGNVRGLGDFMAAFGDARGAAAFRDGVDFETAATQTIEALRGEIQDMSSENGLLKQQIKDLNAAAAEDEPLDTSGEASGKVSFGAAATRKRK